MGRHFNLLILILLMKSTKEQVLFDDMDDRQQNLLNSAMYFIKNELQQMTKSNEKMLLQKFEEIEDNLQTKISTGIENMTKHIVENFTKVLENKLTCDRHPSLIQGMHCTYIKN